MEQGPAVAVVTGASRGIGQVIAERLAAHGHTVIVIGRSARDLDAVATATEAIPLVLDVSDSSAVEQAWRRLESDHGVPTLLVNNAGVGGSTGHTWEQDPSSWWQVFQVNVFGAFLCTRAALPSMLARGVGRIVNVASNAAFYPAFDESDGPINSAYMASKAALIRFTEAIAGETAGSGVRAFAISPGTVKTDMTSRIFAAEWDDPDLWSPPELAADLIEFIDSGALDMFSGRYLHAANDDWRSLPAREHEVTDEDLHTLRVRTL